MYGHNVVLLLCFNATDMSDVIPRADCATLKRRSSMFQGGLRKAVGGFIAENWLCCVGIT
jgi:hypothetical protein